MYIAYGYVKDVHVCLYTYQLINYGHMRRSLLLYHIMDRGMKINKIKIIIIIK